MYSLCTKPANIILISKSIYSTNKVAKQSLQINRADCGLYAARPQNNKTNNWQTSQYRHSSSEIKGEDLDFKDRLKKIGSVY